MGLKRYLIYYSYIGTFFRGVQRQVPRNQGLGGDPSTVQGLIEIALERMKPRNDVVTFCASRTDQGVHALRTALTVDLDSAYELKPVLMMKNINKFFKITNLPIRVEEICRVSSQFSSRKMPLWRKYIYRFATLKPNALPLEKMSQDALPIPITEFDRCYYVRDTKFDLEAVNEACKLFIGTQDFLTFMGKPRLQPEDIKTIRCIHQLYVEPSYSVFTSSQNDYFNYWHLTCSGKSFLYNQVRRTLAVLLAVGQGKLTVDDVQLMFTNPSPASYPPGLPLASASGLYLADIFYSPQDLAVPEDEEEEAKEEPTSPDNGKTKKELIKERLEILRLQREKRSNT